MSDFRRLALKTSLAMIGEPGSKQEALVLDAIQQVARRCAEIADAEAKARENDNPGWSAADTIATDIREAFEL